jgi:hypothetical protein
MSDAHRRAPSPDGLTQWQRDQAETERRMQGPLFTIMADRLKPFPKGALIWVVRSVCEARGIAKPDRMCVRGRICLICFFCTHFPDFPAGFPVIPHMNSAIPQPQRQARPIQHQGFPQIGGAGHRAMNPVPARAHDNVMMT